MGQTFKKYPIYEVALSLEDCAPHTGGTKERKLAGDIVAFRKPAEAIGLKEMKNFLWLRVEGLEENEMPRLVEPVEVGGQYYDKRGYSIPLERLKKVFPSFDIERALNTDEVYQPFLVLDDDGRYTYNHPPLNVHGLIFKKSHGFI